MLPVRAHNPVSRSAPVSDPNRHPSRRDAIRAGLAAGLGLAFSRLPAAAQPGSQDAAGPLITRRIPKTGEALPVVGIGTNQFGVSTPEELAPIRETLQRLPALGLRVVDTARGYGSSEEVIGRIVKEMGLRDRLFLATKYSLGGRGAAPAPSAQEARAGLEQAFARLQTDRIDLMMVHNLGGTETLMPLMQELKQAGRFRYLGISTSSDGQYPALLQAMNDLPLDFIEVDYSIGNRNAEQQVLPAAQEKGIAVLINMPFGGRRASMLTEVAGQALPEFAKEIGATSFAQLFLKYLIAQPAVTAVIPGTRNPRHLEDNAAAARGPLPDQRMRRRIEAFYDGVAKG
ncbi:MAG: aldo/keto reductase [Gemmatimonadetes bacterium]|nr:aldo/keto reductase [Gemmatimonadota bacterium]